MSEKLDYVRKMAVQQLENILNLAGDDVKGTPLEMELKMAIATVKGDANSTVKDDQLKHAETVRDNSANEERNLRMDYGTYDETEDYYDEYGDYQGWEDNAEFDDEDYEAAEPVIPEGFETREEFDNFVESQQELMPEVINEETGEVMTLTPDTVVGHINGEDKNDDKFDEYVSVVNDYVREQNTIYNDETGEEEVVVENDPVPFVRVSFKRNDGNELTLGNIMNNIIQAPESKRMLDSFGDNFNIEDGSDSSEKVLQFYIDENNDRSRQVAEALVHGNGMMTFGGRVVIPGVGYVTARQVR